MSNTPVEKYPPGTKVECLVHYDDQYAFIEEGVYQGLDQVKWLWPVGMITHKIVLANGDVLYDCECIYGQPGALDSYEGAKGKIRRSFRVVRDDRGVYRGFMGGIVEGPKAEKEPKAPSEEVSAPIPMPEKEETKSLLGKLFAK
jgi:hypothetical protein